MARSDPLREAFAGYRFSDPALLAQALTHRSAGSPHNERLEFLGDSLVNHFMADALYRHWPKADEGALTRARAELVRESALAGIARMLQLGDLLVLGPGEMKSGGRHRDSILADAVEAMVAAIFLDAGFEACRAAVLPWFAPLLAALPPPNKVGKDAKTRLQEWLQARQQPLPAYTLLEERGEDHARVFRVSCTLAQPGILTYGEGSSRRAAEQQAAEAALKDIEA
ncbi:ribonuclease III [Thermomonas sp.]|uniref:ribonuclease III n=1 Tax=Thermomonas sp. TaxID=1971895 RepID=UPI001D96708C|nr:ribonuclease III [Thermomonas sp.]MBZ0086923.1 ribonuclease III [Thermomonas sp.]MCO5054397.1 ribonuclease III [Thermomonas sp.]HRO63340.1 ribonuclease III [Thermomonas sp.]